MLCLNMELFGSPRWKELPMSSVDGERESIKS